MNRLAILLLTSFTLVACGGSSAQQGGTTTASHDEEHEHASTSATTSTSSATVVAPGEAHVGDTTTCPISGETFVVTETSPHAEYEGRTYYFCCPGCDSRFQADPAHYVHPAAASTTPSAT